MPVPPLSTARRWAGRQSRARNQDGSLGGAGSSRLRYGGPVFREASGLPLAGGLSRPDRFARLLTAAVRRPRRLAALVVLLLRTRAEHPSLSPTPAGQTLSLFFGERFLGVFPQNRLCRAVLLLPANHAEYLRGRRRQALRTNLRRAARAGIRCETIVDHAEALEATRDVLSQRDHEPLTDAEVTELTNSWSQIFTRPETMVMVARDTDDHARAVIAAVIDRTTCLIRVAVASSHEARWALHDHLVRILIARRARYLLAEGEGPLGALGYERELQRYQVLLGYELRHLIPRVASEPSPGP